jgi:hypothetical protein
MNEMNENGEVTRSEEVKYLARSLETGKSKEAKSIEGLIKETKDETFKAILRDKLDALDQPDMSIERVVREIEGLGYSERYILKLGLSKLGNQLQWQEKQEAKKSAVE